MQYPLRTQRQSLPLRFPLSLRQVGEPSYAGSRRVSPTWRLTPGLPARVLDRALALAGFLRGVGGERGRQLGACVTHSGVGGMGARDMRPRLRMQRLVRLLPPAGEQRPLSGSKVRPAQVLVALSDDRGRGLADDTLRYRILSQYFTSGLATPPYWQPDPLIYQTNSGWHIVLRVGIKTVGQKMRISKIAALGVLAVVAVVGGAPKADAAFIATIEQVGANVVVTGGGTIDLAGLAFVGSDNDVSGIDPNGGAISIGSSSSDPADIYVSISGPASFGSGQATIPSSSGSGDKVIVLGSGFYVSRKATYLVRLCQIVPHTTTRRLPALA